MRSRVRTWLPSLLLVSPSIVLVAVFVYGLIGWNVSISLSDRHTALPGSELVGLDNYSTLLGEARFLHSLRNLAIYTVTFLGGTMLFGLLWAILLERRPRGEGFFRAVYLFPMAVSFVASGVVWRWLLNSSQGEGASGLNRLLDGVGLGSLQNPWWSHPEWGMAAMAMPAMWQLSGYVMALFLAGFRGVPDELREAARVDGASEWKLHRHVLFPQVSPVALSAVIVVGHMSLKVFDLIMSVSGPIYVTEVPATYMWTTLLSYDYAKAATISTVLLLVVAVLVVPYLAYTHRTERHS